MEILAHTLWATAAAKAVNHKGAARISVGWFAAWAAFPDLFAFVPEVLAALAYRAFAAAPAHPHFHHLLGIDLYAPTHSLAVFAPVFLVVSLILRRPAWNMLGWALHVLMDIPTHSARYPTPFLWPVSSYRIIGIAWRQWWFMALNYAMLAAVFILLQIARRRARCPGVDANRKEFGERNRAATVTSGSGPGAGVE